MEQVRFLQKNFYETTEKEENNTASFNAEMFFKMSGEIHQLKAEVSELRQALYKQNARQKYGEVSDANQAMEILKMKRDAFRKIANSAEFKAMVRVRTNAKNARFYWTDDLIEYAQHIFSKDFSTNGYFINPDFYEEGRQLKPQIRRNKHNAC